MVKKLVTRSEFAAMAGVSGAAVTKAAAASLKGAISGKRIDAAHPDAVLYLEKQARIQTAPPAPGLDPLYAEALKTCQESGQFTAAHISRTLKVGAARARVLRGQVVAATPPAEPPPPPEPKKPHVRGTAARKVKRMAQAVDKLHENGYIEAEQTDSYYGQSVDNYLEPEYFAQYADMTLRQIVTRFGTHTAFSDWLKSVKAIEDIHEKRLKNEQTMGNLVNRDLIRVSIIEPINTAHVKIMTDGAKTMATRVPAMAAAGMDIHEIEQYISDQVASFIRPVAAKVERAYKNA